MVYWLLDLLLKRVGFSLSILRERINFGIEFSLPHVFGDKGALFNCLLGFQFIDDRLSLNLSSLKNSIVFFHFSEVCGALTLIETIFSILLSLLFFDSGFEVSHDINKTKHWLLSFSQHLHLKSINQSAPEFVLVDLQIKKKLYTYLKTV